MLSIEGLEEAANAPTLERRRAEAMGFEFGDAVVVELRDEGCFVVRGTFKCVCGKHESYSFMFDRLRVMCSQDKDCIARLVSPAHMLRSHGSFSRQHLLNDGYTPERVDEIIRKGEEFDRAEARVHSHP